MRERSEFRNDSKGQVGAVVIGPQGKETGIAVAPGESVWLSEDEQVLTANAPRRPEDNPFANGNLVLVTAAKNVRNRRPIGEDTAPKAAAESTEDAEPAKAAAGSTKSANSKSERQSDDADAKKAPAADGDDERTKRAQKQAEAREKPVDETGNAVAPGEPKAGKRKASEEVATPEAVAKAS